MASGRAVTTLVGLVRGLEVALDLQSEAEGITSSLVVGLHTHRSLKLLDRPSYLPLFREKQS